MTDAETQVFVALKATTSRRRAARQALGPLNHPIGSLFVMCTSKAHAADGMRLRFSEVFRAQRSAAVNTNTDGYPVDSRGTYKALHEALISAPCLPTRRFEGLLAAASALLTTI